MSDGYIYCFSNQSMPNLVKIGITERNPKDRLFEANRSDTWRPPTPYKIEFAKKVSNPKLKELALHTILSKFTKRIYPKREFFESSIDDIKCFFDLIDGQYWSENEIIEIDESSDESDNDYLEDDDYEDYDDPNDEDYVEYKKKPSKKSSKK